MSYYKSNVPKATDGPSASQADLLSNFTKLDTDYNVDHVGFSSGSNRGKHKKISFALPLDSDPDVSDNESVLYTKNNPADLFFANENESVQLNNLQVVNGTISMFTNDAGGTVTSAGHRLTTGNSVVIQGLNGISGINGKTFTVTVMNANTFSLGGTPSGTYVSGGVWTSEQSERQGFITPWGWIFNMGFYNAVNEIPIIYYSIPFPDSFKIYTAQLSHAILNTFGALSFSNISNKDFARASSSVFPVTLSYLIIGAGV